MRVWVDHGESMGKPCRGVKTIDAFVDGIKHELLSDRWQTPLVTATDAIIRDVTAGPQLINTIVPASNSSPSLIVLVLDHWSVARDAGPLVSDAGPLVTDAGPLVSGQWSSITDQ